MRWAMLLAVALGGCAGTPGLQDLDKAVNDGDLHAIDVAVWLAAHGWNAYPDTVPMLSRSAILMRCTPGENAEWHNWFVQKEIFPGYWGDPVPFATEGTDSVPVPIGLGRWRVFVEACRLDINGDSWCTQGPYSDPFTFVEWEGW